MMTETRHVRQHKGDGRRRWFADEYFDLIVWQNDDGKISRFELCYGKIKDEHVLVWHQENGHAHLKVDDGEGMRQTGIHKMTPIFVSDGHFDRDSVAARFHEASKMIDQTVATFIYNKLTDYNSEK